MFLKNSVVFQKRLSCDLYPSDHGFLPYRKLSIFLCFLRTLNQMLRQPIGDHKYSNEKIFLFLSLVSLISVVLTSYFPLQFKNRNPLPWIISREQISAVNFIHKHQLIHCHHIRNVFVRRIIEKQLYVTRFCIIGIQNTSHYTF